MSKRTLKTKLCDMLGIEYPILSAGMGPTLIGETTGATVELVVAVSEAGGLGVLDDASAAGELKPLCFVAHRLRVRAEGEAKHRPPAAP